MESRLSCRELVEFLADYLAGRLPVDQAARFDRHLAGCPACATYARTYEDSVRLGRGAFLCPDDQVPGDVPEDLVRAILDVRKHEP